MRIILKASIPIDYDNPESFIEPVLLKVYAFDNDDHERLVGQLYAELIFVDMFRQTTADANRRIDRLNWSRR